MDLRNITGKLLVAVPGLEDPNFRHSVVLVCEHSGVGAFGLVVNRVLMKSIRPLTEALGMESAAVDFPVYYGGPVKADQGYLLFSPFEDRHGAIRITDDLGVTASKEALLDITRGKGPSRFIFTLGFSGWTANQLEAELMGDSWLVAPPDLRLIYSAPVADRWRMAGQSIGVDFARYVGSSGRA